MPRIRAAERLKALVHYATNGCWVWNGSVRGNGYVSYGMFWLRGKAISAHRAAWLLFRGEIADDMQVCHSCDNGLCVNPEHLFLGTALDNARDMQQKGRQKYGTNPLFGSKNPHSKLSLSAVLAIRSDTRTHSVIAKEHGIHQSQVSRIKTGKRWQKEI